MANCRGLLRVTAR